MVTFITEGLDAVQRYPSLLSCPHKQAPLKCPLSFKFSILEIAHAFMYSGFISLLLSRLHSRGLCVKGPDNHRKNESKETNLRSKLVSALAVSCSWTHSCSCLKYVYTIVKGTLEGNSSPTIHDYNLVFSSRRSSQMPQCHPLSKKGILEGTSLCFLH